MTKSKANPKDQKNIVILGGSYAGVATAHFLLDRVIDNLPNKEMYAVILISASPEGVCRPACPRAMLSDDMFTKELLFLDIQKRFERHNPKLGFRFILGTASKLDHTKRSVTIDIGMSQFKIDYYALVIATGASTPSPLHGLNRDAEYLRSCWKEFRTAMWLAKSIVIAGGGPTGIETAGELGECLNGRTWFGTKLAHPKVSIIVVTAGPRILPTLRPSVAERAEGYLAAVGVTVIKNARVKKVDPKTAGTDAEASSLMAKATVTLENGKKLLTDLYIPATGTIPNTKYIHKCLLTSDGRVENNPMTLRVERAGALVYAIGDVASYSRPAIHLILEAVPVLCRNMQRDLLLATKEGRKYVRHEDRFFYHDERESQLVVIGKSKGVGAMKGWYLPSFLVHLIKGRHYWMWATRPVWSGMEWSNAAAVAAYRKNKLPDD
ncbi:MAG: hypothetical protein Q9166_002394 [cf. Caloplaca sp. 2 TL-2023]